MTDTQIVAAECPVPVVVASWGVYPLTPCCKAAAKGWADGGVICKGCYEEVHELFGDCWKPDDDDGWFRYRSLLLIAGVDVLKVAGIAAYVREKAQVVA